jgi:two-component system C4-dicarboxylate transport sensor histidine kinase DctB
MQGTGSIEAHARRDSREVVLAIRDAGPGIVPQHLERVFEPFFTTKQPGEGIGLGLAISYEIVHELGGSIRAANHPQGGARFEIALPI